MSALLRECRLIRYVDLEKSTQMFGQLANPNGANNPLSQVLYGLALRYVLSDSAILFNSKY